MSSTTITFSDWSGGDSGRARPAPNDLSVYRGVNVWLYPNGALAPRPNWFLIPFTGLPTNKTMRQFGASVSGAGSWFAWTFADGTVYSTAAGAGLAASSRGTLPSSHDPSDMVVSGERALICSLSGGGARLTAAGTFTSIADMPNQAALIVEYGPSQTVVLQNNLNAVPKLFWSSPNDPTSWPAANVNFIGGPSHAQGLYVQRNTLVIPKINGELWTFTGTLGVNEVHRYADRGYVHPYPTHAKGAVVGNSTLYYATGRDISGFTGAQFVPVLRPDLPTASGFKDDAFSNNQGHVIALGGPDALAVIGTVDHISTANLRRVWMQTFGADRGWGRHTVPINDFSVTNNTVLGGLTSTDSARGVQVAQTVEGSVILCTATDAAITGTAPRVVLLNTRLEIPYGNAAASGRSMAWGDPGNLILDGDSAAPVIATFASAEWWAPDGEEVFVRSLTVDFSYDTNAAVPVLLGVLPGHRFDLSVEALQREPLGTSQASATQQFTPSGGSTTDGSTMKRGRQTFYFGDQGGGAGFRWKLADWRGVMVHQVTAQVDLSPARG